MRSKKVTLTIPHRLWEALEKHAPEVGYESARQMLTFMPLYSLIVCKAHTATAPIAQASPEAQDAIIEEIVSAYERGETKHSQYLEHVLSRVVEKLHPKVEKDVFKSLVSEAIKTKRREPKNLQLEHD